MTLTAKRGQLNKIVLMSFTCKLRRHQGEAHGGRAPAKITGLIMFRLGCQIKILVFWDIFGI